MERRTFETTRDKSIPVDRVLSRDGTAIGYRALGQGPAMVMLHGAMESSASHLDLARHLADSHTVYLPDRRGRGLSGPYRPGDGVRTEVDDVAALLDRTGARSVFGIGSGAIVMLEAALAIPAIEKAIIMEPPLAVEGLVPADWPERFRPRLDRELAAGDMAAVLVTGMKAAGLGPRIFDFIPRPVLVAMTRRMLASDAGASDPSGVALDVLAATLPHDLQVIVDTKGRLDRYRGIEASVLLLGESKSRPAFLKPVLDRLEAVLHDVRRTEFAGLGHAASGNPDDPLTGGGARPDLVAAAIHAFLG